MGGAIGEGNVTPAAEFNIWSDPEAARRVFASGIDVTMVGLDVTHRALFTGRAPRSASRRTRREDRCAELLGFYTVPHERVRLRRLADARRGRVAHVVRPGTRRDGAPHVEIDADVRALARPTNVDLCGRASGSRTATWASTSTRTAFSTSWSSASTRSREHRLRRDRAPRHRRRPGGARGGRAGSDATHAALEELGRRFAQPRPDATIVFTPHNVHVEGHFAVLVAGNAAGLAGGLGRARGRAGGAVDTELAGDVVGALRATGSPSSA